MANLEHLEILKQGVQAWNAWRDQHSGTVEVDATLSEADVREFYLREVRLREADLSGATLRRASLIGANLHHAHLIRADLSGATLRAADLSWANLSHTDLSPADRIPADLTWANLSEADLIGANLRGAHLIGANLSHTDLSGADISQVSLMDTVFADTNLTAVRGLETCNHHGPSTLDHRTLAKSGPLPLAFLRGCGLPDALIDYLPSLLNEPFQFYSCFISYASKDHTFAERLYADLQSKGVRCWFAPEDMKIGDPLRSRIDETIRVHDKLLLVLSKSSVTSQWVHQEVETALSRERKQGTTVVFPVRIDNTVMGIEAGWPAFIRNTRHIGDFRRWKTHDVYQQAFDRLLRDLKAAERQPGG
jgi:TIR domain/Pentapeptide repeats (8 copies)